MVVYESMFDNTHEEGELDRARRWERRSSAHTRNGDRAAHVIGQEV
jgi:hypothetical protein